MTTVEANGVTLGVEHFGDAAAPLILLAGGTTMLSWPEEDLPDHDAATMARLFSRPMCPTGPTAPRGRVRHRRRGYPRRRPRRRTRNRRAQVAPHARHGARGADGQPAGHLLIMQEQGAS
jgi:hypothetical protein